MYDETLHTQMGKKYKNAKKPKDTYFAGYEMQLTVKLKMSAFSSALMISGSLAPDARHISTASNQVTFLSMKNPQAQ